MPTPCTAFSYAPADQALQLDQFLEESRGFGGDVPRRFSGPEYHGVAVDMDLAEPKAVKAALAKTVDGTGAEVAVLPRSLRTASRKLIVMDVDSTLIQQEVIELLASYAGCEAEVRAVTEAAMRGELDFAQSLHARVASLAGLPESVLDEVQSALRLSAGAERLISIAIAGGHKVAAVSGGFTQLLDPLANRLGLHYAKANQLDIVGGKLTGKVLGDVIDRAAKERLLRELSDAEAIPMSATVAIGDGANDLDMMAAAGLSLAFNAKPAVREAADAAIWRLDLALDLAGIVTP